MKRPIFQSPSASKRPLLLTQARNFKMARSAHAYVRGSTLKFYEWLESLVSSTLPEGPAVWICGDCHVGNLGPVAHADGRIDIQIRDFDQTVIGNPAHDLIRLGLSLCMAARGSDLPGVTSALMIEQMVDAYTAVFENKSTRKIQEKPETIHRSLREAQGRSWRHLARERIDGETACLPMGKRYWKVTPKEQSALNEIHSQMVFEL